MLKLLISLLTKLRSDEIHCLILWIWSVSRWQEDALDKRKLLISSTIGTEKTWLLRPPSASGVSGVFGSTGYQADDRLPQFWSARRLQRIRHLHQAVAGPVLLRQLF